MPDAFFVLLKVHLHFPDCASLKAKRSQLNPVKAWLRQRLSAAVAEVDHQDSWQRSTLAVALSGGSPARCDQAADAIDRFLEERFPYGARTERVVTSWNDLQSMG